jgi:hypothetical protein
MKAEFGRFPDLAGDDSKALGVGSDANEDFIGV